MTTPHPIQGERKAPGARSGVHAPHALSSPRAATPTRTPTLTSLATWLSARARLTEMRDACPAAHVVPRTDQGHGSCRVARPRAPQGRVRGVSGYGGGMEVTVPTPQPPPGASGRAIVRMAAKLYALVILFAFGCSLFSGHIRTFLGETPFRASHPARWPGRRTRDCRSHTDWREPPAAGRAGGHCARRDDRPTDDQAGYRTGSLVRHRRRVAVPRRPLVALRRPALLDDLPLRACSRDSQAQHVGVPPLRHFLPASCWPCCAMGRGASLHPSWRTSPSTRSICTSWGSVRRPLWTAMPLWPPGRHRPSSQLPSRSLRSIRPRVIPPRHDVSLGAAPPRLAGSR